MHLYASTRAKIDTRSLNTPRGRTRFSGERGGVRKRAVDVASRLWFTLSGSYHLGPAYAARLAIVRTSPRINSRLSRRRRRRSHLRASARTCIRRADPRFCRYTCARGDRLVSSVFAKARSPSTTGRMSTFAVFQSRNPA